MKLNSHKFNCITFHRGALLQVGPRYHSSHCVTSQIEVKLLATPVHYAEVVEIRISKCPTLTNYFSVVYHPGCPKFCVGLRKLPKNLEKSKKEKCEEEKEGENAKNMKGVFAKVKTGLKKFVLINATIFALCTFLANTP